MLFPLQIAVVALLVILIILVIVFRPRPNNNLFALSTKLDDLFKQLDALTHGLKEDFRLNREEATAMAAQSRRELNDTLNAFRLEMTETLRLITQQNKTATDSINQTLDAKIENLMNRVEASNKELKESLANSHDAFSLIQRNKFDEWKMVQKDGIKQTTEWLEKMHKTVEDKLSLITHQLHNDSLRMREAMAESFKGFGTSFDKNVADFNNLQREKFAGLEERQNKLVESTEKRLEQMRETVEEKLQKTLNERLGQSFELVSKQLNAVQQGLGEMQTLAQDVGGLKKVLSNVKMRGGFGEVQLQMLLENILAPEQYEANVITKKGSAERVEFAVKFPNKEGDREYVWLPIDAKFPKDAYEQLQNAYDTGDPAQIEAAQKSLEGVIKRMAKDICEKYIDAPNTTNFGIMFLPFEGLFAEVVRKASLLEEIQRDCHVVITGPTTLAVILNSLQMGFRTLAIQKRSSEVWQVLGAVKKEFKQFGGMLEKAQNNIETGLRQLDDVVGKRTRAIQRKLKGVEMLDDAEATIMIPEAKQAELLGDEE